MLVAAPVVVPVAPVPIEVPEALVEGTLTVEEAEAAEEADVAFTVDVVPAFATVLAALVDVIESKMQKKRTMRFKRDDMAAERRVTSGS